MDSARAMREAHSRAVKMLSMISARWVVYEAERGEVGKWIRWAVGGGEGSVSVSVSVSVEEVSQGGGVGVGVGVEWGRCRGWK